VHTDDKYAGTYAVSKGYLDAPSCDSLESERREGLGYVYLRLLAQESSSIFASCKRNWAAPF
jgi:hypothetical protein